jgi:hypothetical protein
MIMSAKIVLPGLLGVLGYWVGGGSWGRWILGLVYLVDDVLVDMVDDVVSLLMLQRCKIHCIADGHDVLISATLPRCAPADLALRPESHAEP